MIFHLLMWQCDNTELRIFWKEVALSFLKRRQLLMKQIGNEEQNGYEEMVALSTQSTNTH